MNKSSATVKKLKVGDFVVFDSMTEEGYEAIGVYENGRFKVTKIKNGKVQVLKESTKERLGKWFPESCLKHT